MFNPGLVYLAGGLALFIKDKFYKQLLLVLISIGALSFIISLPLGQQQSIEFLNLELILLDVTRINKLLAIVFVFFGLATSIYSFEFIDKKYSIWSQLYIGSSVAILFTGDFFSFYIAWEVMTITSFFLMLLHTSDQTLRKNNYYYFIMQMVGASSLLWAIFLHYHKTGSTVLAKVENGVFFFLVAIGIKLAFIGLHTWMPRNYPKLPFHITILMSAYTTKVGVYALYRLNPDVSLLSYAGVFTALYGVFLALKQTKVRVLLSYHIISQIGYMITAITVGNDLGEVGGIFHLVNHILYKGLLFMFIGVIIFTTEKEDLLELGGLAKRLPVTTFYAIIAALSIAGAPLFNGYTSKLLIKKAIGDNFILSWGLYIAGIGTSLSFLKVIYYTFFKNREEEVEIKRKESKAMLLSMGLIAALLIIFGLRPEFVVNFIDFGVSIDYFSWQYIWSGLQPILIAFIIFKVFHDLIEPKNHLVRNKDIYLYLGQGFNRLSSCLSGIHNGQLSRYLLWILTTLVCLGILLV